MTHQQEIARAKALIEKSGLTEAARKLDVFPSTLANFVHGGKLYEKTRTRLVEKLAGVRAARKK